MTTSNIINLISVLTVCRCPCVESSLVLLEKGVCYGQGVLLAKFCQPFPCFILYSRRLCPWDSPGKNTGVGSHSLLQGIFPNQELNSYLLRCRKIPSYLSQQGSLQSSLEEHKHSFRHGWWWTVSMLRAQAETISSGPVCLGGEAWVRVKQGWI